MYVTNIVVFQSTTVRHFLNMAMSRYTSTCNSNTCISQNIQEYKNGGLRVKNENILVGFLSIHDRYICKLNNSALNLKQVK